ncbi:hypothetical protein AGMMS49975_18540 [Clostridia bacterium]|nr:hypothetical protein AGMMS49975_18540 [Clostridia bacterium]
MCADICVHDTGKGNPHAHIMLTMRPLEKGGKCGQKSHTINGRKINTVDWSDRDKAEEWRRAWAAYANGALRIAGVLTEDNVLDHLSYKRQGIDQEPTIHMGAATTQMERRGIRTERSDINREIEISNAGEQQSLGERLNKIDRRLKTLDEHIRHVDNFKKYRGYKAQYEKLYAEYKTAQRSTGLFAKGKAQKALDAANEYVRSYSLEVGQFETADKYLHDVLQGHFDPKKFPVAKWKDEQEKLKSERGGLSREYAVLKEKVREVEVIRKYAEDAQRAINPPTKKRAQGLEI